MILIILSLFSIFLSLINICNAIKEKNYHSAVGWFVAMIWIILYTLHLINE